MQSHALEGNTACCWNGECSSITAAGKVNGNGWEHDGTGAVGGAISRTSLKQKAWDDWSGLSQSKEELGRNK